MTRHEVNDSYFQWMYQLVCDECPNKPGYKKLLYFLHSTEFTYSLALDGTDLMMESNLDIDMVMRMI